MNYKEKLNRLREDIDFKNKIDELNNLATVEDGYFPTTGDSVQELSNFFATFMKRFGIGKYISKNKWGGRRVNQIQKMLYDEIKPKDEREPLQPPKNPLQLYDDLRKDVKGKQFTDYDFQRIARTETANAKAVYALLGFKELGLKYVVHKTKNDAKVSEICRRLANRELEIDYLLSPAGEKDRIASHVNCRCRYQASMKGTGYQGK